MYSRKQNKSKKQYRRYGKTCKYRKCCKKTTKRMRHRSRARRGGTQTAVGGNMTFQNGQWVSLNPVGGRS
jgi:hypothetical protein